MVFLRKEGKDGKEGFISFNASWSSEAVGLSVYVGLCNGVLGVVVDATWAYNGYGFG